MTNNTDLNPQVDPNLVGGNDHHGSQMSPTALLLGSFGVFVILCLCLRRRVRPMERLARLRQDGIGFTEPVLTEEELQKRREHIEQHLIVREWTKSDVSAEDTAILATGPSQPEVNDGENDDVEKQLANVDSNVTMSLDEDDMEENEHTCPICLNDYELGDKVSSSNHPYCSHVFHTNCIHTWLLKSTECPMCRFDFLNIKDEPVEKSVDTSS